MQACTRGQHAGVRHAPYYSFGEGFFDRYCVRCHIGPAAQQMVRLETLVDIVMNKAAITNQTIIERKMPPAPIELTADELAKLQKFLECGPR